LFTEEQSSVGLLISNQGKLSFMKTTFYQFC